MLIDTAPFSIIHGGKTYTVVPQALPPAGDLVYLVNHESGGLYLILFRAKGLNQPMFWATMPENPKRHDEAQAIGRLIFEHYNPAKS
jgi:hypothetical protein